ncbi:MAG: MBL fold metallo-hydrolase [Micrococcales bacterium]|nr:MBL fold metallo-hydrolase [Micrococcales bacterium]MCL2667429.1 MBL fold metallo-hydrolase [Micrococcales bacterium]
MRPNTTTEHLLAATDQRVGTSVTWLGHASVVLDLDGVRVLTDPLLRRHAGLLRRRGQVPAPGQWAGADAVLVSHLHHDHAEVGSLRLLPGVPVVAPEANTRWLLRHGVPTAVGLGDDQWWTVPGTSVQVRPVPAVHCHRPMPHRPNAATGFIVRSAETTVWFAGDTSWYPQMAQLDEMAGAPVDLALVPVGGWGPRLSGGHMGPVQAAQAMASCGARQAIPVHWGTLHAPASRSVPRGWMDRAGPAFVAACAQIAPQCQPVLLAPGERVNF